MFSLSYLLTSQKSQLIGNFVLKNLIPINNITWHKKTEWPFGLLIKTSVVLILAAVYGFAMRCYSHTFWPFYYCIIFKANEQWVKAELCESDNIWNWTLIIDCNDQIVFSSIIYDPYN